MTNNIPLVITAIPSTIMSGCKQDNSKLPLIITLSIHPQLLLHGADIKLGNQYKKLWNWHQYLDYFKTGMKFDIVIFDKDLNKTKKFTIDGLYFNEAGRIEVRKNIAQGLWQNMFPYDTPVSNFSINKLPFAIVDTLTRNRIHQDVIKAINKCISKINFDVYNNRTGDERVDSRYAFTIASLLTYLHNLKNLEIESILVDPIISDVRNPYVQPLLQDLALIYTAFKKEVSNLQTKMTLAELEEQNLNETREFHKRFTAYSQHPDLLIKTGFLWKYQIEKPKEFETEINPYLSGGYHLFIIPHKVGFKFEKLDLNQMNALVASSGKDEADWNAFFDEIQVLSPLTYFKYDNGQGFRPAPMPETFFTGGVGASASEVKKQKAAVRPLEAFNDYIDVDNDSFSIRSRIIDRKQLFQKIEERLISAAPEENLELISKIS